MNESILRLQGAVSDSDGKFNVLNFNNFEFYFKIYTKQTRKGQ